MPGFSLAATTDTCCIHPSARSMREISNDKNSEIEAAYDTDRVKDWTVEKKAFFDRF